MSRPGTKRKFKGTVPGAQRDKNVHTLADDALAAAQPHRVWLPPDKRLSEKATTVLGCLNVIGCITDDQYDAGEKYRAIVNQYCSSIGVPMNGASTVSKGYICLGLKYCHPCECRKRKEIWNEAVAIVINVSQRAASAVAHVAVYDRQCPHGDIEHLRRGLTALARHFGIDGRKNISTIRNVG